MYMFQHTAAATPTIATPHGMQAYVYTGGPIPATPSDVPYMPTAPTWPKLGLGLKLAKRSDYDYDEDDHDSSWPGPQTPDLVPQTPADDGRMKPCTPVIRGVPMRAPSPHTPEEILRMHAARVRSAYTPEEILRMRAAGVRSPHTPEEILRGHGAAKACVRSPHTPVWRVRSPHTPATSSQPQVAAARPSAVMSLAVDVGVQTYWLDLVSVREVRA